MTEKELAEKLRIVAMKYHNRNSHDETFNILMKAVRELEELKISKE